MPHKYVFSATYQLLPVGIVTFRKVIGQRELTRLKVVGICLVRGKTACLKRRGRQLETVASAHLSGLGNGRSIAFFGVNWREVRHVQPDGERW